MANKGMWNWMLVLAAVLLTGTAECQTKPPVDISGFGKNRPIQVVVTNVSSSECRASDYFKGGEWHHDGLSYDIRVSASMTFKNVAATAVLLYKQFDPAMTERIALSAEDAAIGRFVAGFDGDRMGSGERPKKVSIEDFLVLKPGESYTSTIRAMVFASRDGNMPLHTPGRYWVQLGIDARPDEFYYTGAEKDFGREWKSRGHLVDFILAEPFPIDIRLDPNTIKCKE